MRKQILSLLIFISLNSHAQQWMWANTATGRGMSQSVTTDANGFIYVGGAFNNSLVFDTISLVATGNNMFLAKYDSAGNVIWARTLLGAGRCFISADPSGNVFLTGWYSSPLLTVGSFTLTNAGGNNPGSTQGPGSPCSDVFIIKFDTNGNVVWAKTAGGYGTNEMGWSLSADRSGNLFVTGNLEGSPATFDTITISGGAGFLIKLDAGGNILWGNSSPWSEASSIKSDWNGNLIYGSSGGAIKKYDANGNVLWAKPTNMWGGYGSWLSTDTLGNIWIAGVNNGAFIEKFDVNGDSVWATKFLRSYGSISCSNDMQGNSYITGFMDSAMTYVVFGSDTLFAPPGIWFPAFIGKVDPNGNPICASILPKDGDGYTAQLTTDRFGNTYLAGSFTNGLILGNDTLPQSSGECMFVAKYACDNSINGIAEYPQSFYCNIYPNPSSGKFTIETSDKFSIISIKNILGQNVSYLTATSPMEVDLSSQPEGIYFIELKGKNTSEVRKIVIQ